MRPALELHETLPSTMDAAHARAAAGAGHGTTIWAREQSAGRGTRGREWTSARGGLWLSVVTRPEQVALDTLSLRVGLALADTIERIFPSVPTLQLKWPNDLLIGRRKLAGVLCEARWIGDRCQWVVIGVGVNVANEVPSGLDAIALAEVVEGPAVDLLVGPVVDAIMDAVRNEGALDAAELAACARRNVLVGRRVREPVSGRVEAIAANGALRIRADDGSCTEVIAGLVLANE